MSDSPILEGGGDWSSISELFGLSNYPAWEVSNNTRYGTINHSNAYS